MAFEKGNRPDSPMKRRGGRRRKKVCVFCGKENNEIDYKDTAKLKKYVSERGKILPRRITGNMCKTSESSYSSNQESKTYRFNAIRSGLIEYDQNRISILEVLFFYCFSVWQTIEKGVIWG